MLFFVIFILIPFSEIFVFMIVGEHIGLFTTLTLAFMTAILGGALVRYQGLHTILAMRNSLDSGKLPLNELFDGFCQVAAGALLITPGFITDTMGFLLLLPAVRSRLRHFIRTRTSWAIMDEGLEIRTGPGVIEGDYERLDDKN